MNHNGVISVPAASIAYKAGKAVGINSDGQASVPAGNNQVGVVLQDTDGSLSSRPVDVHLFSGGGIILAEAAAAVNVGDKVGYAATGQACETGSGATLTIGFALEKADAAGDIIRVVVQ